MSASQTPMKPPWLFGLGLGAYAAVWLNTVAPFGFRFVLPGLNYLAFVAAQALPFVSLRIGIRNWRGAKRFAAVFVVLPFALLAVPSGVLVASCAVIVVNPFSLTDSTFEPIDTVRVPQGRVVVYRSHGGATEGFGVTVRQECTVVPGIIAVHELANQYRQYSATVSLVRPDTVRVLFPAYGEERPRPEQIEARLRRLPCIATAGFP